MKARHEPERCEAIEAVGGTVGRISMRHDSGAGLLEVGRWRDSCAAGLGGAEAVGEAARGACAWCRCGAELQKQKVGCGWWLAVCGAQAGEAAPAASHGPQAVGREGRA